MTGRKKFESKVSALFLFHRQLLSDTDMSLSEASFIVKTTLIIQVISSNLPLPAEWNYAECMNTCERTVSEVWRRNPENL